MRAISPQRRLSITKNTNYTSLATERRPSEYGLGSQANMKTTNRDLDTNKHIMEKIHRKSITDLDNQRKVLEKSMLAYTSKMKELTDVRTNTIFRGIQIKMADRGARSGPRSLPASMETSDALSGPVDSAKLRRRRLQHVRRPGIMTDRPAIRTPIEEERELEVSQGRRSGEMIRSISAGTLRQRQRMRDIDAQNRAGVRYSSPDVFELPVIQTTVNRARDKARSVADKHEYNSRVNVTVHVVEHDNDDQSEYKDIFPTKIVEIMTKPKIHIVTEEKTERADSAELKRESSFYDSVRDDGSDSAYSSCLSEDESTTTDSLSRPNTDTCSEHTDDSDGKSRLSVRFVEPNPEDGYLLTVPKVHKRKRKAKAMKAKKGDTVAHKNSKGETLLKKAILKNANSKS